MTEKIVRRFADAWKTYQEGETIWSKCVDCGAECNVIKEEKPRCFRCWHRKKGVTMTLPTPEQIANAAGKRPDNLHIVFVNEVAVAKEAFRAVAKELDRAHVECQSDGDFRVVIMGFLRQQLNGEKVTK